MVHKAHLKIPLKENKQILKCLFMLMQLIRKHLIIEELNIIFPN